ncbi:MAG: PIG-L deacetylase family protein [candidate division FCPU426 bacterium]
MESLRKANSGKKKLSILAIGAHPDDIEIGCAGTLIKLARAGHAVHLAIMTEGSVGGPGAIRRKEQERAARLFKARSISWLGYQDTRVPVDREAIDKLDKVLNLVKPDVVFANHAEDTHQDHRNTSAVVLSATRNLPNVLFFEVPTSVGFQPDVFVDISGELKAKYAALRLHRSQLDKVNVAAHNILECARSMASFRGFQGRVKAAEGFKALRLLFQI